MTQERHKNMSDTTTDRKEYTESIRKLPRQDLVKLAVDNYMKIDEMRLDLSLSQDEEGGYKFPAHLSELEIADMMKKKHKELNSEVQIYHRISCHPLDGVVALHRAIREHHNAVSVSGKKSFFGEQPPVMISVQTDYDKFQQVPWGQINIPGIDGEVTCQVDVSEGDPGIVVTGVVKFKDKEKVAQLAKRAEQIVNTESMYHNKAVSISLEWLREGHQFDPDVHGFKFLNLDGVDPNGLIFNDITKSLLEISLFAFIKNPQGCRLNGIPLKRGILLEGRYGTGKTMTAYVTAKLAIENGFTFIMCEDARDLQHIVKMARRYEPCVIFCEDIDRVFTKDRTHKMDELLNTIDGFQSKGSEIVLVLTTNHVENIHKAMMRPGRLDSVMELLPPDAKAVEQLIHYYASKQLTSDADLTRVGEVLAGKTPAVIREAVERAKIGTISRIGHEQIDGKVNGDDLVTAALSMERHLELMEHKPESKSDIEKFANVLGEQVGQALVKTMPCMQS